MIIILRMSTCIDCNKGIGKGGTRCRQCLGKEKSRRFKEKEKLVFVDVETTGLPDMVAGRYGDYYPRHRDKDAYENARLLSLSYMITDGFGNTVMDA